MSVVAIVSPELEVERYLDMLKYLNELTQSTKYSVAVTIIKTNDSDSEIVNDLEQRLLEASEGRIKFLSEVPDLRSFKEFDAVLMQDDLSQKRNLLFKDDQLS